MAKVSKKEMYTAIMELVKDNEQYVNFLQGQINVLNKRAESVKNKRAEKKNEKAEMLKSAIMNALTGAGRAITLAEVVASVDGTTPQQLSWYIGLLVEEGLVIKEPVKVAGRKIMSYKVAE